MSISNIERMVDAIVRDYMNYVQTMSMEELDKYVESLIRDRIELMSNWEITEEYERIA